MQKLFFEAAFMLILLFYYVKKCDSHGRMEEPPSRNSAWRHGFNTPVNYNDVELNCGGTLQSKSVKNCGICGDPIFLFPKPHEVGGKYATGQIVRNYEMGQWVDIHILLTANHLGYMEFRICPVNSPSIEATYECLDENLLEIFAYGTRYPVFGGQKDINLKVKLPNNLKCSQCVLQWKYRAGNNWGTENGYSGLGFGVQEEFYNCADISIAGLPVIPPILTTSESIATTTTNKNELITNTITLTTKETTEFIDYYDINKIRCLIVDAWVKYEGMMDYCKNICSDKTKECPSKFCLCHGINSWFN